MPCREHTVSRMEWALVIAGIYLALSATTFVVFWMDKRRARAGKWRISERTLLTLSILGGWPGAMLAMHFVRHKTRTRKFTLGVPAAGVLHGLAWFTFVSVRTGLI